MRQLERPTGNICDSIRTMITRNSLFGRSTNLTCFTATVSPVFQLRARYTDPKAPLPRQSPSCFKSISMLAPHKTNDRGAARTKSFKSETSCDRDLDDVLSSLFVGLVPDLASRALTGDAGVRSPPSLERLTISSVCFFFLAHDRSNQTPVELC